MRYAYRVFAVRLLTYLGAYLALAVVGELLKMPQQMTVFMVFGYLAALVSWNLVDGR